MKVNMDLNPTVWRKQKKQNNQNRWIYCDRIDTAVWMHNMEANKTAGEEARQQLHKNAASNIDQVLAATLHKTPTIRPPASHHENYPS